MEPMNDEKLVFWTKILYNVINIFYCHDDSGQKYKKCAKALLKDYELQNMTRWLPQLQKDSQIQTRCEINWRINKQDTKCEFLTMNDHFLRLGPFLLEHKNKAGNYIAQVPHVDENV